MASLLKLTACVVDLDLNEVRGFAEPRRLTRTEAALLRYLAGSPLPVSREELLREVWGYASGVDSPTVFNTIRRLRTKIEANPAQPDHVRTVRGVGYRFVGAPARTSLIGREDDVRRVESLLEHGRLVTVLGPGGMGKTRLAREVLHRWRGVAWFCDLSEAHDAAEVRAAVTEATRSEEEALDQPDALLVLDNLEQVVDGAVELIRTWLDVLPGLSILGTSRAALELSDERVHMLGPLPPGDAATLFRRRARSFAPGFDAADALVEAIVQRVDGIPLAVELAAGRIRVLAPEQLLTRLDDHLAILRGGMRDMPARHATLQAVVDGSWDLLADDEQVAFARCSVFHGGFDLDAAEAVLGPAALDLVDALVARTLLWVDHGGAAPRFRVYEVLRAYARAKLEASGEAARVRTTHAHHYALRWERPPLAELDNCLAACRHAEGDDAARLILALQVPLRDRHPLDEILPLFDRALARVEDPAQRALLLRARGEQRLLDGRLEPGEADLEAAHALAVAHRLPRVQALVWAARGVLARRRDGDAVDAYRRALDLLDPEADARVIGSIHGRLGLTRADLGDLDGAMEHLDRALALHRQVGNTVNEANVLVNRVSLRQTHTDADLEELATALRLAEGAGSYRVIGNALALRARLLDARAEPEAAARSRLRAERYLALSGNRPETA